MKCSHSWKQFKSQKGLMLVILGFMQEHFFFFGFFKNMLHTTAEFTAWLYVLMIYWSLDKIFWYQKAGLMDPLRQGGQRQSCRRAALSLAVWTESLIHISGTLGRQQGGPKQRSAVRVAARALSMRFRSSKQLEPFFCDTDLSKMYNEFSSFPSKYKGIQVGP